MCVIINIIPNVYWIYNNPNNKIQQNDYNIEVNKYCDQFNIRTLVELDDKLSFWNTSVQYINDIKNEVEQQEFSKLLIILKKTIEIVKTAYITNNPILISTYNNKYIEIGLAIWIYYFNINANIAFGDVIKLMAYKIIGNILMSDTLKKFFAFLNIKHTSEKYI